MKACTLCPRQCGIDRSAAKGACRVGDGVLVGAVVVHRGEEPPLVGGAGSGAVFFCGCPMRCSYCQNAQISQRCEGRVMTTATLADAMLGLRDAGCSNINLVSPTHYTPQVVEAVTHARALGVDLPIIVNSGGYETKECLALWKECAPVFLMDLKYGDNAAGNILSGVDDYWDVARDAITFLWETAGPLATDDQGRATGGLMVRHLVLPGMVSNPFAVLEFLSEVSPAIPLSVMSQYNPEFYRGDMPEMKRRITPDEYRVVLDRACELGFETIYCQDMAAPSVYNPDFAAERPFADSLRLF